VVRERSSDRERGRKGKGTLYIGGGVGARKEKKKGGRRERRRRGKEGDHNLAAEGGEKGRGRERKKKKKSKRRTPNRGKGRAIPVERPKNELLERGKKKI